VWVIVGGLSVCLSICLCSGLMNQQAMNWAGMGDSGWSVSMSVCLCSGLMNQQAMNWAGMGGDGGADMYRGGGGRSMEPPSNKVLRLDSSGNLHPDYDSRGRRSDRPRSSYRNDRR